MTKRNGWITKALSVSALAAVVGGGWVAIGGRLETPADVANARQAEFEEHVEGAFPAHVEDFETHVAVIDTFLIRDAQRDMNRAQRTELMAVQTRLTCMRTGRDTLVLLGIVEVCDSLTGR